MGGTAAIAAGAGLIAIGTLLKSAFGNSPLSVGTAVGSPGAPGLGTEDPGVTADEELSARTNVAVEISGQVFNTRETAQNIVDIINESFDTEGTTIARV